MVVRLCGGCSVWTSVQPEYVTAKLIIDGKRVLRNADTAGDGTYTTWDCPFCGKTTTLAGAEMDEIQTVGEKIAQTEDLDLDGRWIAAAKAAIGAGLLSNDEDEDVLTEQVETWQPGPLFEGPGNSEWLVLDDDEADEAAQKEARRLLWAFKAEWLANKTELPVAVFSSLAPLSEDAQDAVEALIKATGDIDDLLSDAVEEDGRGHFLAGYDGNEVEVEVTDGIETRKFYVYRSN